MIGVALPSLLLKATGRNKTGASGGTAVGGRPGRHAENDKQGAQALFFQVLQCATGNVAQKLGESLIFKILRITPEGRSSPGARNTHALEFKNESQNGNARQ